jgi:hypothetical protein
MQLHAACQFLGMGFNFVLQGLAQRLGNIV